MRKFLAVLAIVAGVVLAFASVSVITWGLGMLLGVALFVVGLATLMDMPHDGVVS